MEREREGGRGRQSAQSCGVIGRGGDVSLMLDVSVWAPLAAAPPRRLHQRTPRHCHTHTHYPQPSHHWVTLCCTHTHTHTAIERGGYLYLKFLLINQLTILNGEPA